jgi:PAS domain S-box-containing protein
MRTITSQQAWLRAGIILTAVAIFFALDRLGPSKLAVEILYLPLVLCAAWVFTPRWTWALYFLCAGLISLATSLELSDLSRQEFWLRIANTTVETLMGAVVTGLALLYRGNAIKLQDSYNSLRASEDQLRRSESLYRSLVENIPQCVFRKDLVGRFTYANSRFCEAVGRTVDQVVGATDFSHSPPHLAIKYRTDDRQVVETGMPLEIIEDLHVPGGKVSQLQTLKTPVYDSEGKIIGVQGVFRDITEKLVAEELLRRSEREFRNLAENLPDIVARFDRQLRHVYVNRAVQTLTGLPVENFIGKTNRDLEIPEHLVNLWDDSIRTVFQTAAPQAIEFAFEGYNGLRHFECRMMPESGPDGSVESVLAICRDVTDRIHAQEQSQLHLTELAHATRLSMIGGLVSEIAHEINQPLHAIANFSQAGINVLQKIPIEQRPNLFNWLKQISEQANRAAEIIRNAGRFVRKTPSRRSSLNINLLVRDSLLLINFDLRSHNVMLRCELDDSVPLILADTVQIQQVLMNLIRNAIEAVSDNSDDFRELLVRTTHSADGVQVSVHDNGTGLSAEQTEKLFEPFFTTKSDGTGLGLAVCQSIMQAHQGRLWAENNPVHGATFYFSLPAFKEEPHNVYCDA